MKTPINQAIEEFESVYTLKEDESEQTKTLKWCVQQLKNNYLKKERQMIMDVYHDCIEHTIDVTETGNPLMTAKEYLDLTYNNKQNG